MRRISRLVAEFQIFTSPLALLVASCLPSAEKAIAATPSSWAGQVVGFASMVSGHSSSEPSPRPTA
jgi:hypothetical protein